MSCILKLKQIYEDLTEVDKKIADYILENAETSEIIADNSEQLNIHGQELNQSIEYFKV